MVESNQTSDNQVAYAALVELKVELPRFERRFVGNKEVIFYQIYVAYGRRKWKIEKRYNDFFGLDSAARQMHPNLPKLPQKTFFTLKTDD